MTRIAVFGAGAIGCWVGGRLSSGGSDITLIGRPRVMSELASGLRTSELHGTTRTATPTLATDAAAAANADLVLVTVKSAATEEAARELAPHLKSSAVIVSLQNGVRNVRVLKDALPDHRVLAGMVPFNVIRPRPGQYHRASAGALMFEAHDAAAPLSEACVRADLPFELRDDMPAVQWSKLVMNLNNAINALSGVPLARELGDREFRRCLAAAQREAVSLIRAADQPLARVTPLPTAWLPRLLTVPDGVFKLLAGKVVAIDPTARSSMWDDLEAKRPTEIDYISGEIVALADRLGAKAPVNARLVQLVRDAERGGKRDYTGTQLRDALGV
ncbi:MAG: 2-dehydropantoate 2-reductase [Kofleriaceae bacterium]|nr:2-dehydropantoate 2-reductase [Kofleriaceae bacterium]